MTGGGVNWGGVAFDPVNQIVYGNTSHAVHIVKLILREEAEGFKTPPGHDFGPQRGAPFAMTRAVAISPLGLLCNRPPWGELVAVDLKAGKILWRSSVGTSEDRAPLGIAFNWGTPLVNGVVITAGGLVFTGAMDAYLHRVRRQNRRRTLAGQVAGPRCRQSHDLSLEGRTICGDRSGRSFRSGHVDRRQRGGFSLAAAGRSTLAVVAHGRPARRAVLEQGARARARGRGDCRCAVALAPSRQAAPARRSE